MPVCKALSHALRRDGYSVTEILNGADAIKVIKSMRFHVVITDLIMEGLDGFDVMNAVKESAPLTSIIVITGDRRFEKTLDILTLGAEYILIKPFDTEELVSKIESCLDKNNFLMQLVNTKTEDRRELIDQEQLSENENNAIQDMVIDQLFWKNVSYLDLNYINESQDVIYIVDAELILKAYNKSWINFARFNNGENVLIKFPLGSRILDAVEGPLKSYFARVYKKALQSNKPFEQNFKCSTSKGDRFFRQSAYPLKKSVGLVSA